MVKTAGEVFSMKLPDCGRTACMERAEGLQGCFVSVFWFEGGASSWNNFRVKLWEDKRREGSEQVRCDTMIKWSR